MIHVKNHQINLVRRTIKKFEKSQVLKKKLLSYIEENKPELLGGSHKKRSVKFCGNVLRFRRSLETGEKELYTGGFCKYDRICIACATKRAIAMIKKFEYGVKKYNLLDKKWYYIVLTIKHNKYDSLQSLMDKLTQAKNTMARNFRNSKRASQKSKSFFSFFDGMVTSIEISHKGNNGWHPHINILGCTDSSIPIIEGRYKRGNINEQLKKEWLKITGDSYIHNIREIRITPSNNFHRNGIGEVFKYAIKFSDLSVEQLVEILELQSKNRYRFFSSYGIFRGWKFSTEKKKSIDRHEGVFLFDEEKNNYNLL